VAAASHVWLLQATCGCCKPRVAAASHGERAVKTAVVVFYEPSKSCGEKELGN